jgi:hypothetical protein
MGLDKGFNTRSVIMSKSNGLEFTIFSLVGDDETGFTTHLQHKHN